MSTEDQGPLMDRETVLNFNEMEYQERIVKLLEVVTLIRKSANDGIASKPENCSEAAWMGAKLGEIHTLCNKVLEDVTNG